MLTAAVQPGFHPANERGTYHEHEHQQQHWQHRLLQRFHRHSHPGVVGWTFEDAFAEAIEYRRDQRLYGSRKVSRTSAPAVDDFEAQTGWTREDAFAEAVEHRTDERLFGSHRHH
ncbi:MAG: hypothetical protein IPP97_10210 [Candidatus Obscuribacter sp.]|nr:hypothetical protein [Candidatus Obscuribacter sp.]